MFNVVDTPGVHITIDGENQKPQVTSFIGLSEHQADSVFEDYLDYRNFGRLLALEAGGTLTTEGIITLQAPSYILDQFLRELDNQDGPNFKGAAFLAAGVCMVNEDYLGSTEIGYSAFGHSDRPKYIDFTSDHERTHLSTGKVVVLTNRDSSKNIFANNSDILIFNNFMPDGHPTVLEEARANLRANTFARNAYGTMTAERILDNSMCADETRTLRDLLQLCPDFRTWFANSLNIRKPIEATFGLVRWKLGQIDERLVDIFLRNPQESLIRNHQDLDISEVIDQALMNKRKFVEI